jgi:perosamine synthetase
VIRIASPVLGDIELENLKQCIETGWISSAGAFVTEFEEGMADLCSCEYGIATSSGTTALHLALAALGVQPGDEVLVPCLTFVASASTVRHAGAHPWCLDPLRLEEYVTPQTKGIVAVHLYGHPCDMDAVRHMAKKHGLWVLEDAAEALGAQYRGQSVGGLGDVSIFSFFANKTITTGEGGMALTNSPEIARRARLLRDHGMTVGKRYWYEVVGFNYRMTNLQAAVGCAQLKRADDLIAAKRQIAARYEEALGDLRGIRLPREKEWASHGYWMYTILLDESAAVSRDTLAVELRTRGIETRRAFYPLHRLPPYQQDAPFPVSERVSETGLSLPSGSGLGEEDQEEIIASVREILGE